MQTLPGEPTGRDAELERLARSEAALTRHLADSRAALSEAARQLTAETRRREVAETARAQAEKVAALGRLTGGVAHDFNNILAAIDGSYRLLQPRLTDPKLLAVIAEGQLAAQRAMHLVRQLMAFVRREDPQPRLVDLAGMLGDLEKLVGYAVGPRIVAQVRWEPGLWPVLLDPLMLEAALLNLAANARDAMPEGGSLLVTARNLAGGAPCGAADETAPSEAARNAVDQDAVDRNAVDRNVADQDDAARSEAARNAADQDDADQDAANQDRADQAGATRRTPAQRQAAPGEAAWDEATQEPLAPGDMVMLTVRDTGLGMSPAVLARATEPFFTTKAPGHGTGLGLANVQAFVARCGGRLRVESRIGEGTVIELLLPRAPTGLAAPSAAVAAELPVDAARHGAARILLVDDDQPFRILIAGLLRSWGYEVLEAATPALACALAHLPEPIDLLVTDVMMPTLDGPALAERLQVLRPGLPALFVTGDASLPAQGEPAPQGMAMLRKPFTPEALGRQVLTLLGRRPPDAAATAPRGGEAAAAPRPGEARNPLPDRRLQSAALRGLDADWRRARAGKRVPRLADLDIARHPARGNLVVVAVDAATDPVSFRFAFIGQALAERLDCPREGEHFGAAGLDLLGSIEGAYRRVAESLTPAYERASFDFGEGAPLRFERLIVPYSADGFTVTHLVGAVVFDGAGPAGGAAV